MIDKTTTILLHGLGRDCTIMADIEKALRQKRLNVCNMSYPSQEYDIATLSKIVAKRINDNYPNQTLNFVTHSLGGIILRYMHAHQLIKKIHRAVMLTPPNQGTPIIQLLRRFKTLRRHWGPAALQLASDAQGIHNQLTQPVTFECGVIAGNKSNEPWFSWTLLKGEDDGKVTVESTKLNGMKEHLILKAPHPTFPQDPVVIAQTLYFLEHGFFKK